MVDALGNKRYKRASWRSPPVCLESGIREQARPRHMQEWVRAWVWGNEERKRHAWPALYGIVCGGGPTLLAVEGAHCLRLRAPVVC